jgi:AbrB family looped-hinge helix DNA binding protein
MKSDLATVTTKGQLVIPSRIRRKYAIHKGTQIAFVEEGDRIILQPVTPEFVSSLRGCLPEDAGALKILLEERRRERKL